MSPSYVLKDKALDYSNLLSAVPELKQEKPLNHARKSSGSKFSTKIEFVKPIQRTTDSPCSVQSHGSFEKSVSNDESLTKELFSDSSKVFRSKNSENLKSLIQKAKQEIQNLRNNKTNLQSKLKMLEDSLRKIEEIDKEELKTIKSIELKLEKLENQQLHPEEDSRVPEAIVKISNLEADIVQLKSLKDSSVFHYEEQLKDVYHKLKDLHECNEILSEMVNCFHKEPIFTNREVQSDEAINMKIKNEIIGIKVSGLLNYESILEEALAKREQLLEVKTKLETEFKSLPNDSKSMSNKRRRLALEFELSMNYSQLISINNKIKRYSS